MFYRNGQALGSVNSAELKAATKPKPKPEPEPEAVEAAPEPDPVVVPIPEPVLDDPGTSGSPLPVVGRPSVTDRKAEWVDFAVAQGAGRDEAEVLTKAELVELFGDDKR